MLQYDCVWVEEEGLKALYPEGADSGSKNITWQLPGTRSSGFNSEHCKKVGTHLDLI